ncbi:DUF3617 domain-containing protein [Tsuneonella mangrovi]|uniref:DUF3617 domain-containing protein n=1 Tax=Tsuneonella mangrovi TaxID=1982042 RepID=UPI001F0AA080|nr:type II toxin-antitoxin system RelE/ParE family toxin [Tsuneonella mangrovi]
MSTIGKRSAMIAAALGLSFAFAPAIAQAPALAMLDKLKPGMWEVRFRDSGETRRICLKTGRELIQLKHGDAACNRFVVEDGPSAVTVQYTCRGNGYGRTNIRQETPTLAQVDSQGIAGGQPFEFLAEARRVGSCS